MQNQQNQIVQALLAQQLGGAQAISLLGQKKGGPAKPKKRTAQPTHLVPEAPAVVAIGDHERKVDLLLKRRRIEVQVATAAEPPVRKKVRVYVTHRHAHQPAGSAAGEPPQWSLHLSGRVDPDTPADPVAAALAALQQGGQSAASAQAAAVAAAAAATKQAAAHPFTSLWRRVTVTLRYQRQQQQQQQQQQGQQQQQQGEGEEGVEEVVLWEKSRHKGPHKEELQLLRIGSRPVSVTIKLEGDNTPPRFRLPPQLAPHANSAFDMRQGAARAVERALAGTAPPSRPGRLMVTPGVGAALGLAAGAEVERLGLMQLVAQALEPVEPVVLHYEIDFSSPPPCGVGSCYDFMMDMPTKMAERPHPALEAMYGEMEKELEEPDRELQQALGDLAEARRKRTMLLGFSQDPAGFVEALTAAQARDLRAATGAGAVAGGRQVYETPRRSDAFNAGWVEEAVLKHLLRKRTEQQQQHQQQQQGAYMRAPDAQQAQQLQHAQLQHAHLQMLMQQQAAAGGGVGAGQLQQAMLQQQAAMMQQQRPPGM